MQAHPYATEDAGFSLVEILVAFAVISIITAAMVFTFNPSKAKAEAIIHFSNEVYYAFQRYEIDTGCVPRNLLSLTSRAYASQPFSNLCNADVSARWDGPYLANTNNIKKDLGPNGWFFIISEWSSGQRLMVVFFTQKSIALQAKRSHLGGLQLRWCNVPGGSDCYIWITYR